MFLELFWISWSPCIGVCVDEEAGTHSSLWKLALPKKAPPEIMGKISAICG